MKRIRITWILGAFLLASCAGTEGPPIEPETEARETARINASLGQEYMTRGQMEVALDIRADMWAQPMPLELYLRSTVDITTGEVSVERRL